MSNKKQKPLSKDYTVDAGYVIRCKDCKHNIDFSGRRFCQVWAMPNGMGDEGFCNYGERKQDGK